MKYVLALLLCIAPVQAQAQLAGIGRAAQAVTNSTTSPVVIPGIGWTAHPDTAYGFSCVIAHLGTATSGPRFHISGPSSPALVNIRWARSTSATAQTNSTNTAFAAAAQTAAITSGGTTTALSSLVYGVVVTGAAPDNGGEVKFWLTSSTAGQTVTVYRGSSCIVY